MSEEFGNDTTDIIQQKRFYPYEYMSHFEKSKEELPSKETFYSFLTSKIVSDTLYEHVINVWNKFEMKTAKDYHEFCLKCDALFSAYRFDKLRNISFKNYGSYPNHYLSVPSCAKVNS